MGEIKHYTDLSEIIKDFNRQTKVKKILILGEALDYMEQNNSRSKFTCIALAMGYKNDEGEKNTWYK